MKKRKLEKALKNVGWKFSHQGGKHEFWTNGVGAYQPIPRHPEVKENTAKSIIKYAKNHPPKEE